MKGNEDGISKKNNNLVHNIFDNSFVKEIFPMDCWWNICTYEKFNKNEFLCNCVLNSDHFLRMRKNGLRNFFANVIKLIIVIF